MSLTITTHQGHTPELDDADIRVVIDVIRAFTTTHVALRNGADHIVLAAELDDARRLAAHTPSSLLAGERNALKPPDFDLGNSPAETDAADLAGRTLVLTTSNGVQATVHALHSGPTLVTGFSNAGATLTRLQQLIDDGARRIQLLASHPDGDEDLACARWLEARLCGGDEPTDGEVTHRIRTCRAAEKFLDPHRPEYRTDDIDYCATRDDADWAMTVEDRDGVPAIRRFDIGG